MSTPYRLLSLAALLSFLASFGIALPYPVLTPLLVEQGGPLAQWFGLDPKLLLGLVLAVYPLGMLLGSNLIGAWSDQYGRRLVVRYSMLGAALGYALSMWAIDRGDFSLLLLSRLLTGFCEGNVAVFRAMAADLGEQIPRTTVFSWSLTATFLGWTFGPLCGGLLMPLGAVWVFAAGLVFLFLGVVLVFALLPQDQSVAVQRVRGQAFSLYLRPDIRGYALVHLIACFAINAYYEYYPLWLVERFGLNGLGIAYYTFVLQVGMLSASLYLLRWFERQFGLHATMYGCLVSLGAGLVVLPWAVGLVSAALIFAVLGLMNASFFGSFMSDYSDQFQHYGQGRIMGLVSFNFSLSALFMALAGAGLSLWGSAWVLFGGGLLAFTSLIYLLAVQRPYRGLNKTAMEKQ